jgi:hypothetical protein
VADHDTTNFIQPFQMAKKYIYLLPGTPPNMNEKGDKEPTKPKLHHRYKNFLINTFANLTQKPIFPQPTKLWGRIFYINHQKITQAADIHNILQPIFLLLTDYVYESDKQIMYFEGIRLDLADPMNYVKVVEILPDCPVSTLDSQESFCLIEIGKLRPQPSAILKITS